MINAGISELHPDSCKWLSGRKWLTLSLTPRRGPAFQLHNNNSIPSFELDCFCDFFFYHFNVALELGVHYFDTYKMVFFLDYIQHKRDW